MPIQVLMPALSPTMTEGTLARWLMKEGDRVKAGQVLAEIETDKATMEVEAVDEGKILKILISGGTQGIKVNTPIAIIVEEGEEGMTVDAAMKKLATKAPAETPALPPAPSKGTAPAASVSKSAHGAIQRVFASPLARRLAEKAGIDLSQITGTGPKARIIRADIEGFIASGKNGAKPKTVAATPSQGVDAKDYADKLGMAYTATPNSSVRKVIARRLTESKQLVPHFYLSIDCELDELLALRKKMNDATGSKISVNDCVIRAVALALKKVPAANASWADDAILQYAQCDVSVAVATPNGLITPIVKKAESKTLAQISAEMKDLAARARDGKLKPEEFQGGGFSVSNLGMFGIKEFAAIINPPQSCILAVGAGEQRPVVKNGQIAIATVMTCTLSIDHRAVDGAVGAEVLAAFKPLIENPYGLVA